jgi:hypothetical protein
MMMINTYIFSYFHIKLNLYIRNHKSRLQLFLKLPIRCRIGKYETFTNNHAPAHIILVKVLRRKNLYVFFIIESDMKVARSNQNSRWLFCKSLSDITPHLCKHNHSNFSWYRNYDIIQEKLTTRLQNWFFVHCY